MDIQANNIVLDCQGHTIGGINTEYIYGIYVPTRTNVTIKNCILTGWFYGIYIRHSQYNNLSNISTSSNTIGIYMDSSNFNTIINITSNDEIWTRYSNFNIFSNIDLSHGWAGIELDYSNFNTLSNITSKYNTYGIWIYDSDYITVKDSDISYNYAYDIKLSGGLCHHTFENVIGTDNKPIVFYNSSVVIKDWNNNVSEIILCNADYSVIDNLVLSHTIKNVGLYLVATTYANISNSIFTNLYGGITISSSHSNTLSNITTYSNVYGIYLEYSSSNTLSNITTYSNDCGIYFSSTLNNFNTLSNITTYSNVYGIAIENSHSNTLSNITTYSNWIGIFIGGGLNILNNSIIQNNENGIILSLGDERGPNTIYNNIFNNTNNFGFDGTIYPNYWNTSYQSGNNIWNASLGYIGGNYWTNPDGNGYSDTCHDTNADGFCDDPYVLATDNIDYLPIARSVGQYPTPAPPAPRLYQLSPIAGILAYVLLPIVFALVAQKYLLGEVELTLQGLIRYLLIFVMVIIIAIGFAYVFSVL
jgi:parallel beta-helix repeat protein